MKSIFRTPQAISVRFSRWALMIFVIPAILMVWGFKPDPHGNSDLDHAAVLKGLNKITLEKGRLIYAKSCSNCHGANGIASYPQARSFSKDPLHYGKTPYAMWKTVSNGAGLMAAQTWLSPTERYYVIQYIRETFLKPANTTQYFQITDKYLAGLPKPARSVSEQLAMTQREALKGSQKYGQEWFRNQSADYGPVIHSQLKGHTSAAFTVLLDHRVNISYNLLRMNTEAVWQGDMDLGETKYRRYRGEGTPVIRGREFPTLNGWHWDFGGRADSLQHVTGVRTPLPNRFLDYHGFYVSGKNVVLSYAIEGRNILEYPQALAAGNTFLLSRTLSVSPGDKPEKLFIDGTLIAALFSENKEVLAGANTRSSGGDIHHRVFVTIPASTKPIVLQIVLPSGVSNREFDAFSKWKRARSVALKNKTTTLSDPQEIITRISVGPAAAQKHRMGSGSSQSSSEVRTQGVLNANKAHFDPIFREDSDRLSPSKTVPLPADYPYTVDNIGLPFDNPYHSWVRPTCMGFKKDGSLIIGTYMGDVWIAKGIDDSLKHITWRRIAKGLFEPMGLKVVNDQIFVTTRNGIVRLKDLNGDGETDFYENFFSDPDVSSFFHAFNFGLETDSKGNFYYTKVGEYTDNKEPGNVLKISPDGKKWESIATGFRVNNGITITPDDRIFVSDNQGNWEPANKICLIDQPGGESPDPKTDQQLAPQSPAPQIDAAVDPKTGQPFYGYVPNLISDGWSPDGRSFTPAEVKDGVIRPDIVTVPTGFRQPVIWMPQEFDNSPGGGVWSDKSWGPLGDRFINTSYGTGWLYYFLTQEVSGTTQGALVALPFQLDAGIQRAAVNPVDKQIYVVGLTGWDDPEALKYGVLSRVRYKGGQGHLLTGVKVVKGGIELNFNCKLDNSTIGDTSNYESRQWNYKWASDYGSDHYSIREPGKKGEDRLPVASASLVDEGHSVVLRIPEIGPAETFRLRFEVRAEDGTAIKNSAYLTIHTMPD